MPNKTSRRKSIKEVAEVYKEFCDSYDYRVSTNKLHPSPYNYESQNFSNYDSVSTHELIQSCGDLVYEDKIYFHLFRRGDEYLYAITDDPEGYYPWLDGHKFGEDLTFKTMGQAEKVAGHVIKMNILHDCFMMVHDTELQDKMIKVNNKHLGDH